MRKSDGWKVDKQWEEDHHEQVITILTHLITHLAKITVASDEMDKSYATDFELKLTGGTIAVRLRRANCRYRDLTLRIHRDSGAKTEVAKIKEGHAFCYFYGWADEQHIIAEWILVDLDKVRASGLLEKDRPFKPNFGTDGKPDGTYFIAIPIRELYDAGCLLAYRLKNKRWEQVA